jgi:hypothetical protein
LLISRLAGSPECGIRNEEKHKAFSLARCARDAELPGKAKLLTIEILSADYADFADYEKNIELKILRIPGTHYSFSLMSVPWLPVFRLRNSEWGLRNEEERKRNQDSGNRDQEAGKTDAGFALQVLG